jgi:hypothetical protein
MELGKSRPGHHQHSEHADRDCGPAPRPDPFAEHRPRQRRHQKRRRKGDGQRLVEPQVAQREEVEHGRAEQQRGAADLQDRPPGAQQPRPAKRVRDRKRKQEGESVARPHDLHHRDLAPQIFRRGVEASESADRTADQRDADQPRTAGSRLTRCGIGEHIDGGFSRNAASGRRRHAGPSNTRQNSKMTGHVTAARAMDAMREVRGSLSSGPLNLSLPRLTGQSSNPCAIGVF